MNNLTIEQARKIRQDAITTLELTKGLPYDPSNNTLNTMIQMANNVLKLTNTLDMERN